MFYDTRLQLLTARTNGLKPSSNVTLFYELSESPEGNTHEALLVLANHIYMPSTESAQETGRIEFSISNADYADAIMAKEIYNEDSLSLGMDTTLDVDYDYLDGFTVESIVAGGERHILLTIDEDYSPGLDFTEVMVVIEVTYPAGE